MGKRGRERENKRGLPLIFLALVLALLLSLSVFATHQTVNVRVTPAESGPLFVGEDFDVKVLLSIPAGQEGNTLYGATLNFYMFVSTQITYPDDNGPTTSEIFNPLEQNGKNNDNWIMDGSSDSPFTLTTTPARLGTIPLRATQSSGPATILLRESVSPFVQSISTDGVEHLYTIAYTQDPITVREHQCGDSFISGTEKCDDGNTDNTDSCLNCQNAECGDGFVQSGVEQCDNAAANSDSTPDACRTSCVNPSCGDTVIDSGEACDNGPANANTAACKSDCSENTCGDGFVEAGVEQCDDGQANSDTTANACRTSCVNPSCGDNVVDSDEGCDDGCGNGGCDTNDDGDGCSSTCATEDADGDGVNDGQENAQCLTTPAGYTVIAGNVYVAGALAGCIIGDVDLNQLFNSADITSFIFEYNHRTDGFEPAADLNQDTELNNADITEFIFKYNHRPVSG